MWTGATTDLRIAQLDSLSGQLIRVKGVVSGGSASRTRLVATATDIPSKGAISKDGNYLFVPHIVKLAYGLPM